MAHTDRSLVTYENHEAQKFGVANLLEFSQLQGPVVQSVVSLTSSLRVISLTVLADTIHNFPIFFY